jgi:hypothetical protein
MLIVRSSANDAPAGLDLHAASLAALANRVGSTTLSVSSFAACANLC